MVYHKNSESNTSCQEDIACKNPSKKQDFPYGTIACVGPFPVFEKQRKRGAEADMESCGGVNFEHVVNISPVVSMVWISGGRDVPCFVSGAIASFGYAPSDFTSGKIRYDDIVHPADREGLDLTPDCTSRVYRIADADGNWRWVSHRVCRLERTPGVPEEFLWTLADITAHKEADELLRKNEEELQVLLNAIPAVLLVLTEDGECLRATGSREAPLVKEAAGLVGRKVDEALPPERGAELLIPVKRCIETGTPQFFTFEISLGGRTYFQEARVSPFAGSFGGKRAAMVVALDATSRKELEDEIMLQAGHDPLGSPSNRGHFNRKLLLSLADAQRTGSSLAFFMIDLDHFNAVNEAIGRDMADLLLKGVALKIQGACRQDDILYRMEGVNFYLILPRLRNREEAAMVADRILGAIRTAAAGYSGDISLSATIGISLFPDNGLYGKALLRAAETALFSGKAAGGDRFAFAETSPAGK